MAVISKEKYERLKLLPEEYRSNEQREAMVDFERAEAQAPTMAQVRAAVNLHNTLTKNPSLVNSNPVAKQKLDEALKIIEADRAYAAVKGGRVKDAYVQPVKRIPDDLIKNNDFNFNWKSAYENTKGEKLRDTEADYDKLQKFIDSNMFNIDDPVSLQKIAYDMHMYNPNTMKWTDFINSEQGEEFKKYLADVRENQRKTAIKDIFDNESNFAVDFMLPVAKENAKQALLKNEEPNLGVPLAFDAGTNLAMLGGGKLGLVAAPAITNVGQSVSNDMDPAVAGVNTLLGAGTNMLIPRVMDRGTRYLTVPGKKYSQRVDVKGRTDQLAKEAADTEKKILDGAVFKLKSKFKTDAEGMPLPTEDLGYVSQTKKILYSDNPEKAIKEYGLKDYTVKPLYEARKHDAGIIPEKEMDAYKANNKLARNNWFEDTNVGLQTLRHPIQNIKENAEMIKGAVNLSKARENERNRMLKAYSDDVRGAFKKPRDKAVKDVLEKLNKGEKISTFDMKELYALGYNPKESLISFLWRISPETAKNYLSNFAGRNTSAGATMTLPNLFFGTNLNKFVEDKKKGKPKISEIFGGE
jgi:hypothetical protein